MADTEPDLNVKVVSRYDDFVHMHKEQLRASAVPEHFWPTLWIKLDTHVFDAGNAFTMLLIDYEGTTREPSDPLSAACATKEIRMSDRDNIYLIDHAWSYRLDQVRTDLKRNVDLRERIARIVGCEKSSADDEDIEQIMGGMWRYCQMYQINSADGLVEIEDRMPIWYIMDEFGCSITHSDTPNARLVPFIFLPKGETFTLLFPIKNIDENEQVTRDFVENVPEGDMRRALLYPWYPCQFTDIDFTQTEPDEEYFREGHVHESLPGKKTKAPVVKKDEKLKVYTTYTLVKAYLLNQPLFEVVKQEADADVFWFTEHFKKYRELSENAPNKFVNQFPYENVLTVKDLLAIVSRRDSSAFLGKRKEPSLLPTTYNLKTELTKFISYYQSREEKGLDNHWIIKPWNLARGLDTHVTKDLNQILRLQTTGPKLAQKYIDRPVLFTRTDINAKVKFDIRYVFVLKSAGEPIEAYMYRNFFLRFANKPFELNEFDVYEKHFTVMNYGENLNLLHITCEKFLELWQEQYPDHPWAQIQDDICGMFALLLCKAVAKKPPMGIKHSPQSRAMYAADIMLEWTDDGIMQPKLLEVNYMPDCQRACEYYPDFFNDIFKLLFLNMQNEKIFKEIPDLRINSAGKLKE